MQLGTSTHEELCLVQCREMCDKWATNAVYLHAGSCPVQIYTRVSPSCHGIISLSMSLAVCCDCSFPARLFGPYSRPPMPTESTTSFAFCRCTLRRNGLDIILIIWPGRVNPLIRWQRRVRSWRERCVNTRREQSRWLMIKLLNYFNIEYVCMYLCLAWII